MNTAVAGDPFERDLSATEGPPWMSWRWGLCFIAVVALHIGVAWIVLRWGPKDEPAPPPLPPAAVMIDLALPPGPGLGPRSALPPGPPQEPGPGQGGAPSPPPPPPAPQVQPREPPPEAPPEAPPAPVEMPEPPPPAPPAPAVVHPPLPPVPPTPAPRIAVPMPPQPKPETKQTPKSKAIAPHRPVAHRAPPAPAPAHTARSPAAPVATGSVRGGLPGRAGAGTGVPGVPGGRGPVGQAGSAPPGGGGTAGAMPSTAAVGNWQGRLLARLEAFKRYPPSALQRQEQGVVSLRFTIDRAGNVLSASVARSSGVGALDREALALIRRAAPLPPPPPDVAGNAITMVVPVTFRLE